MNTAKTWLNKAFAVVLSGVLVLGLTPLAGFAGEDGSGGFRDVTNSEEWYYEGIYTAAEQGLMTGYGDGTFGPNDTLSRAQVVTILWRYYCPEEYAIYCPADAQSSGVIDGIESGEWYTAAANWAVAQGIITGVPTGNGRATFNPNGSATRDQLCAMLARAIHSLNGTDVSGCESALEAVRDSAAIADWARESMGWCMQEGLITGKGSNGIYYADPEATATRAEMATILTRALSKGSLGERAAVTGGWVATAAGVTYVQNGKALTSRWIATKVAPDGTESTAARMYYLGEDGLVKMDETFQVALQGKESFFRAGADGAVFTGTTRDSSTGWYYLADSNGRLPQAGWLKRNGSKYRVSDVEHACKTGGFVVDGELYYARYDSGAVLVGTSTVAGGDTVQTNGYGVINMPFSFSTDLGSASRTVSTYLNGIPYLFLPTGTDPAALKLDYSRFGVEGTIFVGASATGSFEPFTAGDSLDLVSLGAATDGNGFYTLYYKHTLDAESVWELKVAISGGVSTMYVISADPENYGREYIEASEDHSAKASCTVVLVDPDGTVLYNKDSEDKQSSIKGRGNSTWQADKRPYQVKLSTKASLITGDSSQKSKTWLLLANYYDPTLLRNNLVLGAGYDLGLGETPECRYVDLYYDGSYRGTYLLCEKVQVGDGRVEIEDLEDVNESDDDADLEDHEAGFATNKYGYQYKYTKGVSVPEDTDITGGYLLEKDTRYAAEACWFQTSEDYFVVKSPEYASKEQVCYISEYVQGAIIACSDPDADLSQYFDVDKLAREALVQAFADSADYYTFSSTYYYKDAGDPLLKAGPLWDYDMALGIFREHQDVERWGGLSSAFYFENKMFRQAVRTVFNEEFAPMMRSRLDFLSTSSSSLIQTAYTIQPSVAMNYALWGVGEYSCLNSSVIYATYEENVYYLYRWAHNRLDWMDSTLNSSSWC